MIRQALNSLGNPHLAASAAAPSGMPRESLWFLNSRTSNRMTFSSTSFSHSYPVTSSFPIYTANNTPLTVTVRTASITLHNVLLVPGLSMNLISIGQLCDQGYHVEFTETLAVLYRIIEQGNHVGQGVELDASTILSPFIFLWPLMLLPVLLPLSGVWHDES